MSRRVEITVPNAWCKLVRDVLEKKEFCNYNSSFEKPHMITEITGVSNTVFMVTIPGAAVSAILDILRKNGIGEFIGRVILSPVEYLKPDLSEPLERTKKQMKAKKKLVGYAHFKNARKTTEELYMEIAANTSMRINTWLNLVGASIMAAGGLATNVVVFIVASMLVSPIMGPIIGMTFGYRINNYKLFRKGFINECKMAAAAWICGFVYGGVLGDIGNTYQWPNDSMMPEKTQGYNLIISIIVSAAAGMVLGVSLTSVTPNALVGTAISAGLLPPLVSAGMLVSFAITYAPKEMRGKFIEMGNYQLLFYTSHVLTIIVSANIVFWLKDVNPNFKEKEDSNFNDIPTLANYKKELDKKSLKDSLNVEKEKAFSFAKQAVGDIADTANDVKDFFTGMVTGRKKSNNNSKRRQSKSVFTLLDNDDDDDFGLSEIVEDNDKKSNGKKKKKNVTMNPIHTSADDEVVVESGAIDSDTVVPSASSNPDNNNHDDDDDNNVDVDEDAVIIDV